MSLVGGMIMRSKMSTLEIPGVNKTVCKSA